MTPTAHDLATQLEKLGVALTCVRALPLYDDVYHLASMRGTICVDSDGSITQIRVFDSPTASLVALQDWAVDTDSQWLVQDSNWFAIGPRQTVGDVAIQAGVALTPTQVIPDLPKGYQPDPLDECAQFVSSTAYTYLTDASMFDSDRAAFEKVLPGVTAEVESLIQKPGSAELRGLAPEDLAFESEFSRLGPDVKSFCRDSSTADPT
ncbi:hypothetical protein [Herbiconiux sp. VKM Ac-2851]|uniref:hypothetical protein n=1 Tax=Herbiconiux sp. VKM Ac-2851 TaxID=2739025 RepID=UPI0015676F47|nr:hypothetical protein [Herbiconiux sp. VKM Ac-2851]NQX33304.1 hypothetical protein [Herbiconiux sp. VKM Ac-2851]